MLPVQSPRGECWNSRPDHEFQGAGKGISGKKEDFQEGIEEKMAVLTPI